MASVTACAPNLAPLPQKSPGNCGTFSVAIGHGVVSLAMSRTHASCGACPKQLLAVPSELTNNKLLLCGVPSTKLVCSSGMGTLKTGIELCPPFSGFIVTQLTCGQSRSAWVGLVAQFTEALGFAPGPLVRQPLSSLRRSSIWMTPLAPTP